MVNCLMGLSCYFNPIISLIGKADFQVATCSPMSVIAVLLTRKNDAT